MFIRRHELPLLWAGFMATLCGVGLSRFAYTALMPAMVQAGWFSASQAAYLGAANLLGYLIGALSAHALTERWGTRRVLGVCFVLIALSFALCSSARPFAWFFAWRLLAGAAGAVLMVAGPSVGMAAAPLERRAALGPVMFSGIGWGALLAATVVPLLARHDLGQVWWALALAAGAAGWVGWRACGRLTPAPGVLSALPPSKPANAWPLAVLLLLMAYACDAAGFIPHTVFWVDYLAREQQLGSAYAATQWGLFGLGAVVGPMAAAAFAWRWNWQRAVVGGFALKTLGVGLTVVWAGFASHALSSLLIGALSPGLAALTSGRLMQLVGPLQHKRIWGYATAVFATLQAASGYAMAWLYSWSGQYQPLFIAGLCCMTFGLLLAMASGAQRGRQD